jgi:hypothetical protein
MKTYQIIFSESNSSTTQTYQHAGSFDSAVSKANEILGGGVKGEGWVRVDFIEGCVSDYVLYSARA